MNITVLEYYTLGDALYILIMGMIAYGLYHFGLWIGERLSR